MSLLRRLAVLSFVAAAGLALPSAALAEHRHSRDCGHRYNDGYRGNNSRYDHHSSRGYGYSQAPRYSYRPSRGYAAPYYRSYDYVAPYRSAAPYYDGAYYDEGYSEGGYYDAYSYAPPPPPRRCYRRPRVGLYFGF